jgi:hypothetical protein
MLTDWFVGPLQVACLLTVWEGIASACSCQTPEVRWVLQAEVLTVVVLGILSACSVIQCHIVSL